MLRHFQKRSFPEYCRSSTFEDHRWYFDCWKPWFSQFLLQICRKPDSTIYAETCYFRKMKQNKGVFLTNASTEESAPRRMNQSPVRAFPITCKRSWCNCKKDNGVFAGRFYRSTTSLPIADRLRCCHWRWRPFQLSFWESFLSRHLIGWIDRIGFCNSDYMKLRQIDCFDSAVEKT